MKTHIFIALFSSLIFAACGGGSSSPTPSANVLSDSSIIRGNVVDDFVVGADIKLLDEAGKVIASGKTGDFGFFEFSNIPLKNYRVEISGGRQDVDGLASTANDQKTNTAVITGMALTEDRSKVLLLSALTTGVDQFSAGRPDVYRDKVAQLEDNLNNAIYLPSDPTKSLGSMRLMAVITEAAGGFTKLVRELADDGSLNSSKSASPSVMTEAREIASAFQEAGFEDPALLSCFLSALPSKPTKFDDNLFDSVTELYCNSLGISSIKGIERLRNLETVSLAQNKVSSIAPLEKLSKLEVVNLTDNKLRSFDMKNSSSFTLAVAGNCLSTTASAPSGVRVVGLTRRQKSSQECQLPILKNLTALAYSSTTVVVSYNVQDSQGAGCELVMGTKRVPAKCDGDSYVTYELSGSGINISADRVELYLGTALLGSATIQVNMSSKRKATVQTVTPNFGFIGVTTTFIVSGTDLAAGMGFAIDDCTPSNNELIGGSVNQRQFECVFRGEPGNKAGVVKTTPGGTVLSTFSVFSSATFAPVTPVASPAVSFSPSGPAAKASISVTFSEDMQSSFATTGAYSPESSSWTTPRIFNIILNSYVIGGSITFQRSSFVAVTGGRMASDLVYVFPQAATPVNSGPAFYSSLELSPIPTDLATACGVVVVTTPPPAADIAITSGMRLFDGSFVDDTNAASRALWIQNNGPSTACQVSGVLTLRDPNTQSVLATKNFAIPKMPAGRGLAIAYGLTANGIAALPLGRTYSLGIAFTSTTPDPVPSNNSISTTYKVGYD